MSLTQLPKAKRPLLMLFASVSRSPCALVFRTDSDPAKSTKLNFPSILVESSICRESEIRNTACDLDEFSFKAVDPMDLIFNPRSNKAKASDKESVHCCFNCGR